MELKAGETVTISGSASGTVMAEALPDGELRVVVSGCFGVIAGSNVRADGCVMKLTNSTVELEQGTRQSEHDLTSALTPWSERPADERLVENPAKV